MWDGETGCNSRSIGYEVVNSPSQPFTPAQYASLLDLLETHCRDYPIRAIVGHEHVACFRKVDPGIHFNWKIIRDEMVKRLPKKANGFPVTLKQIATVPIEYEWPMLAIETAKVDTKADVPKVDDRPIEDEEQGSMQSAPAQQSQGELSEEPHSFPPGKDPGIGKLIGLLLKAIFSQGRKRAV